MIYDWIRKHVPAKYRCVTARILLVVFLVPSMICEILLAIAKIPKWFFELGEAYLEAWRAAKRL